MAKRWLVLRVQSNREMTVSRTLEEKVKIEALEDEITRVLVPTESVSIMKSGKRRIMDRKLYPGYVFVEMNVKEDGTIPERAWFLIRETNGVGDFIGTGDRFRGLRPGLFRGGQSSGGHPGPGSAVIRCRLSLGL